MFTLFLAFLAIARQALAMPRGATVDSRTVIVNGIPYYVSISRDESALFSALSDKADSQTCPHCASPLILLVCPADGPAYDRCEECSHEFSHVKNSQ